MPIESPGRGLRLVLVTAAPATGAASRLAGPITYFFFDEPDTDDPGPRPAKRRWFRRGG